MKNLKIGTAETAKSEEKSKKILIRKDMDF